MTALIWSDSLQYGELLSRTIFLDEIKANIGWLLEDYKGKGVENEAEWQTKTATLFTGIVIPSRADWTILTEVLRELAERKEAGTAYDGFIRDVSDSLGISDLEKIKDFINYIATLPPASAKTTVVLGKPVMYGLTKPVATSVDAFSETVTLTWNTDGTYLQKPSATFVLQPSMSEDVASYSFKYRSGSHEASVLFSASAPQPAVATLDWLQWFDAETLANANNVYLNGQTETTDKRGNISYQATEAHYETPVFIPRGIASYEVAYSVDEGGWRPVGIFAQKTTTWALPKENGTYRYRVRALDLNGQYTAWSESDAQYLRFLPDPPDVPIVSVTTTWISATVTWNAVPRAEWYEVWMGDESWAKNNEGSTHNYWQRLEATKTRSVNIHNLNQGKTYTFYVRAGNAGGTNIGSSVATVKVRTLHTVDYNSTWSNVFKTDYNYRDYYGNRTYYKGGWYPTNNVYQGEWVDAPWGTTGWSCGRGAGYCAWGGQQWGNNMSFIYFDYGRMRNELAGKVIQSVTITVKRINNTTHGWAEAQPLYLYGHDRWQDWSTSSPNALTLFHGDSYKTPVNVYNQQPIANIQFSYGETENITNAKTIGLVEGIVAGRLMGLGIVKYYGESLYNHAGQTDKAYMILNSTMSIRVNYYDD